jgi:hypothetical protein
MLISAIRLLRADGLAGREVVRVTNRVEPPLVVRCRPVDVNGGEGCHRLQRPGIIPYAEQTGDRQ